MGNKFLSTILVETSKKDLDQYAARKAAFEAELQKALDVSFPGLDSVEIREGLSMVCSGLSEERAKAIYVFLQWASCKDFLEGRSSKYFGFARNKTGTTKAALLHKRGFPEGDFQWMYSGVTDYGPASTQRCSLSGHPIRYGHLFIARGTSNVNVPALTLSSGSAAALFGMDKTVFDDVIRGQSRALRDIAGAVLARRFGKGTDYLDFLCGATGSFLLLEGLDSVGDLMPFVVDETLFSADACTSSEGSMLACKTPQGVVNRSYGWVREHIYSCLNANLDSAFTRLISENLPASCAEDMRAMVNPLTYAHELISVGLLPTEGLCAVIDKGLFAGIMCHRVPAAEDTDIEDVKDNWKYSVDGDVLTLEKYIGTNPDVVVRNTYLVEGKKFTKVALMETKVTLTSTGDLESVGAGVFVRNEGLKSIVFEEGILLPKKCWCMFWDCNSLESLDLSNFDTSNVTTMRAMLQYCRSLKSLDLSHLNTSRVTDTRAMFYDCNSLESLNLSSFDTSSVTHMGYMFGGCSSLESLDLSHFDTSRVTDMEFMFAGCESLKSLDLSHFDTSKVTNMWAMFRDSVIGTLYFWGTHSDWDALESKPNSVRTLICKDDSPSTFLKSCISVASGAKSTKGLVLCTVRLLSRQDLSGLSSVSVGSDFASGRGFSLGAGSVGLGSGSGLSVYVDESDPSLVHFWVPADMVPMVERMLKSVGTVEYISDSSGRRISPSEFNAMSVHISIGASADESDGASADESDGASADESDGASDAVSDVVLGSSDLGLDFEGVSFESDGYRRLYSLVEDAYGFFTCDVEALRASGDEYAGKTDLGIRRAQLFEVKVLDPAVECALYARELRYPLPDGVQLSSAGLSVLGEYESTKRASRLVLKVLRTECYNAGLLFTASGLLKGVLELLRESEMRDLLRSTSEEMLVDRLVQLLSNYQVVRSGILTVLVGLYRMVEARGAVNLKSRIAKLYNLAKAGAVLSKKLSVQAILDSEKG